MRRIPLWIAVAVVGQGLAALCPALGATGDFGMQIISTAMVDPACVFATDLDGDGDADVLSASHLDNKIAWYENTDGLGSFGPQQVISTAANGADSVFATDFDGDGDMDVLSASILDNKIAWYENTDGLGSFGPERLISAGTDNPNSVFATDIDGDGDMDVLMASFPNKIAWYENSDGLGNFGPQQVISTAANGASSVFATDIDGDGDEDVLSISSDDDGISWYENDPATSDAFGEEQIVTSQADEARSVCAADLDGDGDQDVLSASYFDDKIAWYENSDGLGSFGPQQIITTAANGADSVFAADLDGDGDQDALSASYIDDKIAWYENTDGLGSFGPQQIISTAANGAYCVFAADIDSDGDQDVLSASEFDSKIAWYENTNGLGDFGTQRVISTAVIYAFSVFAMDIDGDGDADVLSASGFDDKIAWYENTNGLGSFGPQRVISRAANNAKSVCGADLDGDGDTDVVSASYYDDKIAWYENTDGLGNFGQQRVICSEADGAQSVRTADIDGDGDEDVVWASSLDHAVCWNENTNGLGDFGPREWIKFSAHYPMCVTLADIDGDGNPDVLSASKNDDTVAWYENATTGFITECFPSVIPPRFTRYGTGYGGTGGVVPTLSGFGRPGPGQSIYVEIASGRPNAPCLFMIGLSKASVTLPSGAVILVGNLIGGAGYLVALDGTGSLSIRTTLGPAATGHLYMQALVEDAGAGNGKYSATNGLEMSL